MLPICTCRPTSWNQIPSLGGVATMQSPEIWEQGLCSYVSSATWPRHGICHEPHTTRISLPGPSSEAGRQPLSQRPSSENVIWAAGLTTQSPCEKAPVNLQQGTRAPLFPPTQKIPCKCQIKLFSPLLLKWEIKFSSLFPDVKISASP